MLRPTRHPAPRRKRLPRLKWRGAFPAAALGLAFGIVGGAVAARLLDAPLSAVLPPAIALSTLLGAVAGWMRRGLPDPEPAFEPRPPMITGLEDRTHL